MLTFLPRLWIVREAPAGLWPPYRPRRPENTAFYRLVEEHFDNFALVHADRFERTDGPLRFAVRRVVRIVDSFMGLSALAARGHLLEFEFSPFFGQFAPQNPPGTPRPSPDRLPAVSPPVSCLVARLSALSAPSPGQTVPGDGPDDAALPLSPVLHVVSVL